MLWRPTFSARTPEATQMTVTYTTSTAAGLLLPPKLLPLATSGPGETLQRYSKVVARYPATPNPNHSSVPGVTS